MPMTTTHALVPLAVTLAFARRPVPWRLAIASACAAAAPDLDGAFNHFWPIVSPASILSHRGAAHSMFVALAAGLLAAALHKQLNVGRLAAGLAIGMSMASHGILDMMTDMGRPVAYLWPLSSARLFADWRPIHSGQVHWAHLFSQAFARFQSELWQLIVPMFALALLVRGARILAGRLGPAMHQEAALPGPVRQDSGE